jgi:hypothetical protein
MAANRALAEHCGRLGLSNSWQTTQELLMAKYGKKASQKVEKAMHELKEGALKSGSTGKQVKSRKQAIAIGLSEARRSGGKVPTKKAAKKTASEKPSKKSAKKSPKKSTNRK